MINTVKRYPKPGHCGGQLQISPGQFIPGREKVGIGLIRVQKSLNLDWTRLGRTRSGLVQCWTGGIIDQHWLHQIQILLHCKRLIQHFWQLVKNSTESEKMKNQNIIQGPYHWSYHNVHHEQ